MGDGAGEGGLFIHRSIEDSVTMGMRCLIVLRDNWISRWRWRNTTAKTRIRIPSREETAKAEHRC